MGWRRDSRASQGEYGLLVDGSETHQGSDQDSPLCLHLPFLFPSTPIFPGIKVPHDHSPNSHSSTQPSFCHAYCIPPLFACWRQCSMAVVNLIFLDRFQLESSEKAMAPHSSTLAWKIPWMEEPGRLWSMGSLRVGHD